MHRVCACECTGAVAAVQPRLHMRTDKGHACPACITDRTEDGSATSTQALHFHVQQTQKSDKHIDALWQTLSQTLPHTLPHPLRACRAVPHPAPHPVQHPGWWPDTLSRTLPHTRTLAMCEAPVSVMPLQGRYSCSRPLLQNLRPSASTLAPLGPSMFQPSRRTLSCLCRVCM